MAEVDGQAMLIRSETYMGLTIHGDGALVREIASRLADVTLRKEDGHGSPVPARATES